MRDYTKKIRKQAADLLEPGEDIFRSVMGNPEGSALGMVNQGSSLKNAAKQVATEAIRSSGDDQADALAARIPKKSAYVTLTDRRVVILGTSAMGKVNAILAEFGLDEVAGLDVESSGRSTDDLTLGFVDGSSYRYTIIQNQEPTDMAEEFARRQG